MFCFEWNFRSFFLEMEKKWDEKHLTSSTFSRRMRKFWWNMGRISWVWPQPKSPRPLDHFSIFLLGAGCLSCWTSTPPTMLHQDKVCVIPKDANGPGSNWVAILMVWYPYPQWWLAMRLYNDPFLGFPKNLAPNFGTALGGEKTAWSLFLFGGLDSCCFHEDPHVLTKSGKAKHPNHPSKSPLQVRCASWNLMLNYTPSISPPATWHGFLHLLAPNPLGIHEIWTNVTHINPSILNSMKIKEIAMFGDLSRSSPS